MKKYLFLITLLYFILPTNGAAQVLESDEFMSAGTHNALLIELEVDDSRLVDKVWKNFMKDFGGKVKKVRGSSETVTTGAEIAGINGIKPMQIFAKTSGGSGSSVLLTSWFDLGEEYLTSSMKDEFSAAEKLLINFALEVKIEATNNELDESEKKMKSFESDLDKLKRQNSGYHKDIDDAEKRILQAKDNILKNEGQQIEASQKILMQREIVEEIKSRLRAIRGN